MQVESKYICDKCGKTFGSEQDCAEHEVECGKCICEKSKYEDRSILIESRYNHYSGHEYETTIDLARGIVGERELVLGSKVRTFVEFDYCPLCGRRLYSKQRRFMLDEAQKRRAELGKHRDAYRARTGGHFKNMRNLKLAEKKMPYEEFIENHSMEYIKFIEKYSRTMPKFDGLTIGDAWDYINRYESLLFGDLLR